MILSASAVRSLPLDAGAYGNFSAGPKKRQRHSATSNAEVAAATTIADLQAASKGLQNKGGADPFPAAMQVRISAPRTPSNISVFLPLLCSYHMHNWLCQRADCLCAEIVAESILRLCPHCSHACACVCQAAGGQGSFAAALNVVDHGAGPSMTPGMPDGSGRTVGWDSPDPNQVRHHPLSWLQCLVSAQPFLSWGPWHLLCPSGVHFGPLRQLIFEEEPSFGSC